jgi:hypothetical protein
LFNNNPSQITGAITMNDFESKEFRSYVSPTETQDFDVEFKIENVQLAEIELDNELLLATHRC